MIYQHLYPRPGAALTPDTYFKACGLPCQDSYVLHLIFMALLEAGKSSWHLSRLAKCVCGTANQSAKSSSSQLSPSIAGVQTCVIRSAPLAHAYLHSIAEIIKHGFAGA